MVRNGRIPSALVLAAEAFDEQLSAFEAASESLEKAPLTSGKHLERMAETLKVVATIDEKLGEQVRGLIAVINQVRDKQQRQAESVLERAKALQARTAEFQSLQEKYAALGRVASELNDELQTSLSAAGGIPVPELAGTLGKVNLRLGQAAEEAKSLGGEAETLEFTDMVRHADGLRQQILSAKNRLQLLSDKLGAGGTA